MRLKSETLQHMRERQSQWVQMFCWRPRKMGDTGNWLWLEYCWKARGMWGWEYNEEKPKQPLTYRGWTY